MRAYDILTDADQRVDLRPTARHRAAAAAAAKSTRTYETMGKVASNTMAATVISAALVGGYVAVRDYFQSHQARRTMAACDRSPTVRVAAAPWCSRTAALRDALRTRAQQPAWPTMARHQPYAHPFGEIAASGPTKPGAATSHAKPTRTRSVRLSDGDCTRASPDYDLAIQYDPALRRRLCRSRHRPLSDARVRSRVRPTWTRPGVSSIRNAPRLRDAPQKKPAVTARCTANVSQSYRLALVPPERQSDHRGPELPDRAPRPVRTFAVRACLPSSVAAAPRPAAAISDIPPSRRDPPATIARCS